MAGGVDEVRFDRRKSALEAVNEYFHAKEKSDSITAMDTFYERAYSLISSQAPARPSTSRPSRRRIRDEYGRNEAGQRHADGAPAGRGGRAFVALTYSGWDMHNAIAPGMRGLPAFDQAFRRWSATWTGWANSMKR